MTTQQGLGRGLIDDNRERGVFRVHRSTMTSDEIYRLERERIFDRCWLYLGHESEVAVPGDFVRRSLMGRPLIFLRDQDGTVRAWYNTCSHRGAVLTRQDCGNTKRFQCFYHAWTFDTFGELVTLPQPEGYGPGFDKCDYALTAVPRIEGYRGFWFVSFNPAVEPLVDYLAGATEYLDLVADQGENGMRVLPGTNLYATGANWKLLVENSLDGYHGLPLHQTYFAYLKGLGGGISTTNIVGRGARQLGNGHVAHEGEAPYGRPIAKWDPLFGPAARDEIETVRRRLFNTHGQERAARMCDNFRNLLVFPNLIVNDITAITVRYLEPQAADMVNITAWALAPVGETDAALARRIDSYLTFIGPGGFATPDDVEALEACQQGFAAQPDVGWNDISRGMAQMPGVLDELQMRIFWRAWAALLDGEPFPAPVELPESAVPQTSRV